jgi:septum formation protein
MAQILLASNSARRRQLIKLTGWNVSYASTDIDESRQPGEPARVYVTRLAGEKAHKMLNQTQADYILAADTIVVDGETIFGKPFNTDDALAILSALRGHTHQVMTALTLIYPGKGMEVEDLCVSEVPMRNYTVEELKAYIGSGDPMDKAGAYAIQNREFHPVEAFSGCFASVMGMPLCHMARIALRCGLTPRRDLPKSCQATLGYQCSIHEAVRRGDIIG